MAQISNRWFTGLWWCLYLQRCWRIFLTARLPPWVHVCSGRRLRRTLGVLSYHFPLYSFETEAFTIKLVQGWWPAILSLPLVDTGAHNCAWLSHGCWVFMLAWRSYPLSHLSLFSLHLPTFCFCFCFSGFFSLILETNSCSGASKLKSFCFSLLCARITGMHFLLSSNPALGIHPHWALLPPVQSESCLMRVMLTLTNKDGTMYRRLACVSTLNQALPSQQPTLQNFWRGLASPSYDDDIEIKQVV